MKKGLFYAAYCAALVVLSGAISASVASGAEDVSGFGESSADSSWQDLTTVAVMLEKQYGINSISSSKAKSSRQASNSGFISVVPDAESNRVVLYWSGEVPEEVAEIVGDSENIEVVSGKYSLEKMDSVATQLANSIGIYPGTEGLAFNLARPALDGSVLEVEVIGSISDSKLSSLALKISQDFGLDVLIQKVTEGIVPLASHNLFGNSNFAFFTKLPRKLQDYARVTVDE